jgi:hypothetical protein
MSHRLNLNFRMKPTETTRGGQHPKASDHEAVRARYRPDEVRLLFVGESPPASGRFFYNRDSGLYGAMLGAFQAVDHSISEDNFLDVFKRSGCYLTDACRQPVDRLDPVARRNACSAGEKTLASRIRRLQPGIIISLVRSIKRNVENAASAASFEGTLLNTPYPGRWIRHREEFLKILTPELRRLLKPATVKGKSWLTTSAR